MLVKAYLLELWQPMICKRFSVNTTIPIGTDGIVKLSTFPHRSLCDPSLYRSHQID
jgi:hypothetical protein